jgi:hypothetical protein
MVLAALLLQTAAPQPLPPPGSEAGCDRSAIRYTPEREWSGVWVNHFEGSQFFEGATSAAKLPWLERPVWFEDRAYIANAALDPADRGYAKAYRIRFIGRRTIDAPVGQRCGFGHFGMSQADIYPTRILSIERLGDLP